MQAIARRRLADRLVEAANDLNAEHRWDRLLERVVRWAPGVVPPAEHVSVTVVGQAGLVTAAASGPLPERVDAMQYAYGEGPCVSAARQGETVVVANLAAEGRWPGFSSSMSTEEQVRSMLAVPLRTGTEVVGSLNLSSAGTWAFPAPARDAAAVLAALAGLALTAALERERATDRAAAALAAGSEPAHQPARLDPRGRQALHPSCCP